MKCTIEWYEGELPDAMSCHECGNYSQDGSWCQDCLDKCDDQLEEYEERKRARLAEQQEY